MIKKEKKVFYWSPFTSKVATVFSVINSAQILNKSKLLRSSMNLLNLTEINSELTKIGFKKKDIFFKWFNFIGIIAIK